MITFEWVLQEVATPQAAGYVPAAIQTKATDMKAMLIKAYGENATFENAEVEKPHAQDEFLQSGTVCVSRL